MASTMDRAINWFISTFFFRQSKTYYHTHKSVASNHNGYYYTHTAPKSTRHLSLQTVELKVRMCCVGCERVVKEAIYRLRGVDSVGVELDMEKVTVTGYVDRHKLLKAVRRAGKRAEFWPYPNPPLYFTSAKEYYRDLTSEYKESYNYYRHGYNLADRHGTIPVTARGDDKVSNMFNDDNVNACSVM